MVTAVNTSMKPAINLRFRTTANSELDCITRYEAVKPARDCDEYLLFTGSEPIIDVANFVPMLSFEDGVLKPSELVDTGYCTLAEIDAMPYDERAVIAFLLRKGYDGIVTVEDINAPLVQGNINSAYPFPYYWCKQARFFIADLFDADAKADDRPRCLPAASN